MSLRGKIIIVTQAHPDKVVERYRRFALQKIARRYPVYVIGTSDYSFLAEKDSALRLAPFLHNPASGTIDWRQLQSWVMQEGITGLYLMDYDDIQCSPPEHHAEAIEQGFFLTRPPYDRTRQDLLGQHHLFGATYIGREILQKLELNDLTANHWLRWRIVLAGLQQDLTPAVVTDDFTQLIFMAQPPYGSLSDLWQQARRVALQASTTLRLNRSQAAELKSIGTWLDQYQIADKKRRAGLLELCQQAILPLKNLLKLAIEGESAEPERPATPPLSLEKIKKIGIIKMENIGDAVLMTPLLTQLRKIFKGEISLLCPPLHHDLWRNCPHIDRLHCAERFIFQEYYKKILCNRDAQRAHLEHFERFERSANNFWQDAWVNNFARWTESIVPFLQDCEVIMIPRGLSDNYGALNAACLTNARWRIMNYDDNPKATGRSFEGFIHHNNGYKRNITHIQPIGLERAHEAENMIDLLHAFGVQPSEPLRLSYWPSSHDKNVVDNLMAKTKRIKRIVVSTGASRKTKIWPLENFITALRKLSAYGQYELFLVGGESDRVAHQLLAANLPNIPTHDFTEQLTLSQTAYLMNKCDLMIGNCSAPAHLAAAANISVLQIVAHPKTGSPTNMHSPNRFGVLGDRSISLQPAASAGPLCVESCYANDAHCILGVTPDAVVAAALEILKFKKNRAQSASSQKACA